MTRKPIHPELQERVDAQPYEIEMDGLRILVDKEVFPPDLGRCARNLARLAADYKPRAFLEMGCGAGYVALYVAKRGAEAVWASDIHPPAVACARHNALANGLSQVTVAQGNLFGGIPSDIRFDLIAFNQPFGPGPDEGFCGCGPDGGQEICRRFLTEARDRLNPDGAALMCFSDREDASHDPAAAARELEWSVKTALQLNYNGANNFIYELRPGRSAPAASSPSITPAGKN